MQSKVNKIEYTVDNNKLQVILKTTPKSDKLIVFLNGAINRNKSQPPVYQRRTWLEHLQYNVLIVPDQTVELNETLELGWYLGAKNSNYIHKIAKLVAEISHELNITNDSIIFYGSSGGGYAAIILSTFLVGSRAISINPQTILKKYNKCVYDKFIADTGHDENTPYLNVTTCMEELKYIPRLTLIQNKLDRHHYVQHFKPFIKWYFENSSDISNFGDCIIEEFTDLRGHNATPDVFESMRYFNKKIQDNYLVASRETKLSPSVFIYTANFKVEFNIKSLDDRCVLYVKGKLSDGIVSMLESKGWMISPKIGPCIYIKKENEHCVTTTKTFDYLSGLEVGILHWRSDSKIEYRILSQ
ncbi:hypothetical protein [Aeromonas sp. 602826]|uniref:hypothetical protein n=1 Tax=unclassified Aeromonas TaxID=257493 RepID=UPI003A423CD5